MNRTLLLKVKEQILAEPESFEMETWVRTEFPFRDYEIKFDKPDCGTAACIGGWACLLEGEKAKSCEGDEVTSHRYYQHAMQYLGINDEQARVLFNTAAWPDDLRTAWYDTRSKNKRAKIAAERIDRFIAEMCPNNKQKAA